MIKSFRDIENNSVFDIVIIGSGAAGITLAIIAHSTIPFHVFLDSAYR